MTNSQHMAKDPSAKLDFSVDWGTDWLAVAETIVTSTWAADSADLTLSAPANNGTRTTTWVDGGVDGKLYKLTNHIVSSAGRIDERTLYILCKNR